MSPKSVFNSPLGMGSLGATQPREASESVLLQQRLVLTVQLSLQGSLLRERPRVLGRGCTYCSHTGWGGGHSRHLWPHSGNSQVPGPTQAFPSNNTPCLHTTSWLNILRIYQNSRLTHTSPAVCNLQERSWCFLPSLTQPKALAFLCLC